MAKTDERSRRPPATYRSFIEKYPELGRAWDAMRRAEGAGPLDERTQRLIKLGIALGAMREGGVHSAVRKAGAAGITREEIDQVIALAASTLGMPATVAVYSWVRDELDAED